MTSNSAIGYPTSVDYPVDYPCAIGSVAYLPGQREQFEKEELERLAEERREHLQTLRCFYCDLAEAINICEICKRRVCYGNGCSINGFADKQDAYLMGGWGAQVCYCTRCHVEVEALRKRLADEDQ